GSLHRSEIAESHARERSTAQEMQNPTRWKGPPLGKFRNLRAGAVHRSGNAESYALEQSTAQESRNLTRWSRPPLRNCSFSCVGWFRYTRTVIKNLIEQFLS